MMQKKILLIATKAEIGGAQNHINQLIYSLPSRYQLILGVGSDGPLLDDAKDGGINVYVLRKLTSRSFFSALRVIYQLIKSEKPDLIHTHSAVASFVSRIAGRLAGVKTLYTVHGWHFVPTSVWKRRVFGWLLELVARPFTTAWIAVSEYDLELGVKKGVIDRKRAWVVPNGIADITIELGQTSESGKLSLVFVGRASFQKNCMEAIDIVQACPSDVTLTMYVTSGDHLPSLRQAIIERGLEQRVSLITDNPNAADELHNYSAMLLTSRYEGMPLCVLEAMRSGLPVIATDVCGLSEIVDHGETGFLYELGDVEGAADQVNQLIGLDIRQKMSIAARKKYLGNFRAEKMAQRTAEIYEELLS